MILRVLIVVAIGLNFTFVAQAEEWEGLVVRGDYKKLNVACQVGENQWGITKTDIERAVKLRLLGNGVKMLPLSDDASAWTHWLKVNFQAVGDVYTYSLELNKVSKVYANNAFFLGPVITPWQGTYGSFGKTPNKADIINSLNSTIDDFLLDYLESNIEHREALQLINEYSERLKKEKKDEDNSSE